MIALRWREAPRLKTRWRLPNTAATPVRATQVSTTVATIIGRQGPEGRQGVPGIPGDGATDPGDLTLIFDNQLIPVI